MKSIKEQQTEYVLTHTELVESYEAYAEKEEIAAAYEAGANHVLECFESVLPFVVKKGIIYGKIKETIEQLKGNQ